MNRVLVFIVLAVSISACAGPGGPVSYNCGQGVCTTLQVVEPVRRNEPVTVVVTVTADKDMPDLGITLSYDYGGEVEDPPASEKANVTHRDKSGIGWAAPVKANQPARFTRKIKLPSRDGLFQIVAGAGTANTGRAAVDSVEIDLVGGTVYGSGTSVPTPLTPIRAITMVATPVPRTPTVPPYP